MLTGRDIQRIKIASKRALETGWAQEINVMGFRVCITYYPQGYLIRNRGDYEASIWAERFGCEGNIYRNDIDDFVNEIGQRIADYMVYYPNGGYFKKDDTVFLNHNKGSEPVIY